MYCMYLASDILYFHLLHQSSVFSGCILSPLSATVRGVICLLDAYLMRSMEAMNPVTVRVLLREELRLQEGLEL